MKRIVFLLLCCTMAVGSYAQQQLGRRSMVKSPVINDDGSVTFNVYAPEAQKVSVNGDFEEIRGKRLEMAKQENGLKIVELLFSI